jgi:hypothetical protein
MVSGKPSNQSARQVDIPPTTRFYVMFTRTDVREYVLQGRREYGFCSRATDVCPVHIGCAYGPAVACGGPDPRPGMKGKRLLWNTLLNVPSVCARFTLQGQIRFESSASHED